MTGILLRRSTIALIVSMTIFVSAVAQEQSNRNLTTMVSKINRLFSLHQKRVCTLFAGLKNIDSFDRSFFSDFSFLNDDRAKQFFNTIEVGMNRGKIPVNRGITVISYSAVQSFNGRVSGVNYQYLCDGKHVRLIRGTYNNGTLIKAVYNYSIDGMSLKAEEFKGDQVIQSNTHMIEL